MFGLLDVRASARAALGKVVPGGLTRLVFLGLGALAGGCDSGSFMPPRPAELGGGDVPIMPGVTESARPLVLLEASPISPERSEFVKSVARSQAGVEGVRVEILGLPGEGSGSKPSPAALLDEAVGRKPLGILIDLAEAPGPELARSIEAARSKGTAVTLVGLPDGPREAAASAGAAPLVSVFPESLEVVSNRLVEAAVRAAKNAKYKPEAGAIILQDPTYDSLSAARFKAMRDALTKAGISKVEEARYEKDPKDAQAKLNAALKAHPEIRLVLGTDPGALSGGLASLADQKDRGLYVLAGYAASDANSNMAMAGDVAGMAIYSEERLLRKAVSTAVAAGRGNAPARPDLVVPLHFAPPNAGEPKAFRGYEESTKNRSAR